MLDFLRSPKRKKGEITLVLDIGSEAVKALVFQRAPEKINILGNSLEYLDNYGAFDSRDFERDVLKKTIFKTLQNLGLENLRKKRNSSVILGLPANIFKARVVFQNLKRKKSEKIIDEKEEKLICHQVLEKAKKETAKIYSENSGILPQDIQFINLKILEIKIDGYRVPGFLGYKGRNLDFRILTTFLAGRYLEEIENICQAMGFKEKKIFHEVEGLISYFTPFRNQRFQTGEGIFLDLGGEVSQIFLAKNDRLERIDEFGMGGKIFSQAISEKLGLKLSDSRILKERYSKKELSKESLERIKEILWPFLQTWFENLKSKLKEMSSDGLLPQNIILFGGGGQLAEIKEILKEGIWENFSIDRQLNVKTFWPADLKIIEVEEKGFSSSPSAIAREDEAKILNNSQYTPPLLLYYAFHYDQKGNRYFPTQKI